MKRLILGFGHKRRRGKDLCCTLAHDILEARGCKVRHDAFAYSLKEMARVVFGLSDDQLYGKAKFDKDLFWGLTPRDILQRGGTEAMRHTFGQDIWVKTLERRLRVDQETSVVIPDVRFPNEVEALLRLGGAAVLVNRPVDQVPPATSPEEDLHASETSLDGFDRWSFTVQNDSTIDNLRRQVEEIIDCVLAWPDAPATRQPTRHLTRIPSSCT